MLLASIAPKSSTYSYRCHGGEVKDTYQLEVAGLADIPLKLITGEDDVLPERNLKIQMNKAKRFLFQLKCISRDDQVPMQDAIEMKTATDESFIGRIVDLTATVERESGPLELCCWWVIDSEP